MKNKFDGYVIFSDLDGTLLNDNKEVSKENIDRLIGMRKSYGVTGRHPGFKRYRKEQ